MKSTTPLRSRHFWYGSISVILVVFGVLLMLLRTWIFDSIVDHELLLGPNTKTAKPWISPPSPLYLNFYLFNWTNPEDINDPTKKPIFEEVGPYRFIDKKEKVNLTWNNNDTVTYRISHTWFFDAENSPRKLSDKITTLNMMVLGASKKVKNWGYWTTKGFSLSLAALGSRLHITQSAKELLFDGYQDSLLDMAHSFSFLSNTKIPFKKMGFMLGRNGSYTHDGVYNVATGAKGNNGELLHWNYVNYTGKFKGECNRVHGSANDLFHQRLSRDFVDMFTSETCSSLRLHYENDTTVKNIQAYTYSGGSKIFDNGTLVPENECYSSGEGLPNGLLNITSCKGAEVFISLPHFYGADPIYLNMIDGMKPVKEKHDVSITLEPRVGIVLDVAFRLQSNFLLEPVQYLTLFENVPKVVFPTLWFEQKFQLPDDIAASIKLLIVLPPVLLIVAAVLIVLGILGLVIVLILNTRIRNNNYNVQQIKLNSHVITEKNLPKNDAM